MKKLFAFLLLALALPALGQRVTLTVTVTNKAVTGDSITVSGGTRYFTNATKATTIATNLTSINATKTNLFNQFAAYPWSTLTLADGNTNSGSGTNAFRLVGSAISATLSGGWGYLTLSTQAGSSTFPMLYPLANVVGETNRTNQASDVVAGLNSYATNLLATNAGPLGNYLTKGASSQQVVVAPVQFNGTLRAGGAVALTNGFTRALTNINPVTSNLMNYGNAIRSEGSGGNSLQIGSNALASGSLSMAVGNSASATADGTIAIGTASTATNAYGTAIGVSAIAAAGSVAVGNSADASGYQGIAVGFYSQAIGESSFAVNGGQAQAANTIAIGSDTLADQPRALAFGFGSYASAMNAVTLGSLAQAAHSNSLALGPADHLDNPVTTTSTNQLRLGTANHSVSIPGQLLISGTQSNTTFTGTNLARGAWAYPRFDLTTLAAGNNLAVPIGTNRFVRVGSGPASAATIVGMVGGATSGGIDGQDVVLFNDSGYGLTFAVNSVDPVPANRINTPTATDVTVPDQGWAQFFYDGTDARWKLINAYSGTNLVATATNVTVTINTNGTSVGSALTVNFTTGVTGYVSGGTINLGVSAAGGGGSSLVTNGNQFAATTTLNIKKAALVTNLISYVDSAAPALVLKAIDPTSTNIFEGRNLNDEVVTRLDGGGWLFSTATIEGYAYKSTSQTGSKVLATDGSGNFVETTTPTSTLAYITNVTSDIQAQLNGKMGNSGGKGTNLLLYGSTTNYGTLVNATSYHSNLIYQPVTLVSPASTLTVDMAGGSMQVVTMTNNTTIALTNAAAGANVSVMFIGPTNNQWNLIMPSTVRLFSGAITNIVTTNKSAVVSFTAFNSTSTDIVGTVAIQP